jgi:uncharacterized membrane protein
VNSRPAGASGLSSGRAESFSDGVFAVAITVLVFNLLPIAAETAGTRQAGVTTLTPGHLLAHWPAYLAYLVSFLTIGIMWLNHHTVFAAVRRLNRTVLVLNLLLLLGVVALPFPTALVADHLNDSAQGKVAAVTYGLVMMEISVCYATTWVYLNTHARKLGARREIIASRLDTLRFTAGNGGYVAGTVLAFFWPVAALIVFGLLAVYYLFEHLPAVSAASDSADGAGEPD